MSHCCCPVLTCWIGPTPVCNTATVTAGQGGGHLGEREGGESRWEGVEVEGRESEKRERGGGRRERERERERQRERERVRVKRCTHIQ